MPDRVIPADMPATTLRRPRFAALIGITTLVVAAAAASFAESYRALVLWAVAHGLHGVWAGLFPIQVDSFIAVGELALFVALADQWSTRSPAGAWFVTALGLAASVAANVGHVAGHAITARGTAAIPPLAASAALAVGLGVLKRVVNSKSETVSTATAEAVAIEDMSAVGHAAISMAWPRPEAQPALTAAPVTERPATRTSRRTVKPGKPAAKAADIVRKSPDISGAELGRKLGMSERSGKRLLARVASS